MTTRYPRLGLAVLDGAFQLFMYWESAKGAGIAYFTDHHAAGLCVGLLSRARQRPMLEIPDLRERVRAELQRPSGERKPLSVVPVADGFAVAWARGDGAEELAVLGQVHDAEQLCQCLARALPW